MGLFKLKPVGMTDFAALVRPGSPNSYLVCPPGFSGSLPDQEAPKFNASAEAVASAWTEILHEQPRTIEIERSADGLRQCVVQRTRFLGFPDVITAQIIALTADTSTLAVYSRSQYGHSDLGANGRRVKALLSALTRRLS